MASSSGKTIMDLLKQPSAKRLKRVSSPPPSPAVVPVSSFSSSATPSPKEPQAGDNGVVQQTETLTPAQNFRMEFNKSLAKAKFNLKLCAEKVSCSISEGEGSQYVKLKELLVEGSWLQALPEEFEKPYAKNLCKFVESEIRNSSVPVYPPQHLIFNALNTTSIDKVKAVIIGQDPYHGPGQAMGLSFSVPEGVKVPSSLVNIYKELNKDLGCSIPSHGNLEKWAIQGVLLLNAVLTVRHHQANSHSNKGWEQYTDAVIRAISQKKKGVVFLLWGNYAQAKGRLIDETKHHVLKSAHPSGLSANRGFFGCRLQDLASRKLIGMGRFDNGLYYQESPEGKGAAMSAVLNTNLWHQRLGHASDGKLQHITFLKGFQHNSNFCDPCLRAKQTRLSFPKSTSIFRRQTSLWRIWGNPL